MAEETIGRVAEELGRVRTAKARAEAELVEVREALEAELYEEGRLLEEAARAGRPAKPRRKIRDLRERGEELTRQLGTLALLLPRLEVEALEEELAEKGALQRSLESELEEAEARYREAEAARREVLDRIHWQVEETRDLQARLRVAQDGLAAADPAERERRLEEQERRREELDRAFDPGSEHNQRVRREALAAGGFRVIEGG